MRWNSKEEEYLKESYHARVPLEEISEKLDRTIRSIQRKAQEMRVPRPRKKFSIEKLKIRKKRADEKFYIRHSKKIYERKKQRRHEIKRELVSLRGGKCELCGYCKCISALEFHHKGDKEDNITYIIKNKSKEKVLKEIEKCLLVCANCHRELHKGA